jgi:hypothetical protein
MENAPGRSGRRFLRPVWIVPGTCVLALVGVIVVVIAIQGGRRSIAGKEAHRRAAMEATARSAAFADLLARLRQEPDPMAFVQARVGREDSEVITDLIQAYAAWGARGDALEARRLIVKTFVEDADLKVGLEALLKAVAMDTTPRRQDPLWHDLVKQVGGLWNAVTIAWGRDLVHIETNPKAKDLILESLAEVTPQKITVDQQNLLVADLIDLYPYASADQRPALERALAAMAGADVVEILGRRGINEGSTPIASIQKINQEVETSRAQYKKVLEKIEREEREAEETNAREAARSRR